MKLKHNTLVFALLLTGCSISPQFINTPAATTPIPELPKTSMASIAPKVQPEVQVILKEPLVATTPRYFSTVYSRKAKKTSKQRWCAPCRPSYRQKKTKPKLILATEPTTVAKPKLIRTKATIPPSPYVSKEEAQDPTIVQQRLLDYIKVLKDELKNR